MSLDVTLTLGTVLKIAQANAAPQRDHAEVARGQAKAGGPPSVSVSATPLDGGRMKVTIEYYQDGTGRLRSVTAEGTLEEIESEVPKAPSQGAEPGDGGPAAHARLGVPGKRPWPHARRSRAADQSAVT